MASLYNRGWEFTLRTTNVRTKNITWTTSFNITFNKGRVTDTYYQDLTEVSASGHSAMADYYQLYIKGQPIRAFYGYKFAGIDPHTGGTLAYIDGFDANGNRLGSLNEEGRYVFNMEEVGLSGNYNASRCYLGQSDPPITGGFGTQFNYKRFSLSAQFTFMTDFLARNYMYYDATMLSKTARNVQVTQANRWRKPGDITNVAKYENGRTEYLYQIFDLRFDKGNFLKCNNISLGYNLSSKLCSKLMLTRARVNFHLANPFTLTKFRGIDPETKGNYGYPSARSYKLSISLGF